MNYVIIILRLIHILAGILWVGSAVITAIYIGPSVGATAEAGQKFMLHLMTKTNFQKMMMASAGSTVIAGALLYIDKPAAWFRSSAGIGFGVGAFFAIAGFVYGILISRNTRAMLQVGSRVEGQPTPEQILQLQDLQNRQRSYSILNVGALILAVAFMATARYFAF